MMKPFDKTEQSVPIFMEEPTILIEPRQLAQALRTTTDAIRNLYHANIICSTTEMVIENTKNEKVRITLTLEQD